VIRSSVIDALMPSLRAISRCFNAGRDNSNWTSAPPDGHGPRSGLAVPLIHVRRHDIAELTTGLDQESLRRKREHGSSDLKQAYVRLAMREVSVRDKDIRISGSKPSWHAPHPTHSIKPRPQFSLLFGNGAPGRIRGLGSCSCRQ
jgi:hypothetical protein